MGEQNFNWSYRGLLAQRASESEFASVEDVELIQQMPFGSVRAQLQNQRDSQRGRLPGMMHGEIR